jgi:hypothetical protein
MNIYYIRHVLGTIKIMTAVRREKGSFHAIDFYIQISMNFTSCHCMI